MDFIFRLAEEFLKKHKRLNRYRRVFAVIAAVVVFATTYELILPAITMDKRRAADTPGVEVGVAADSFEEEAAENESGESVEEENAGEESGETPEVESADSADTDADSGNGSDGSGNAADTDAASGHSTAGNADTDIETSEGHSEEAGQEDGSSDDANVKAEAADHADTADTGSSDQTDASADKNGKTTETVDNGSTSEAVDPASAAATTDPSLIAPGEPIVTYPATLVFEGKDYTITATFDETAGLPADVRLDAVEILPDVIYKDENGNPLYSTYEEYYEKAVKAVEKEKKLEEQGQTVTTARFFDITFLDNTGLPVEPKTPVSIAVKYKDALSAVDTADTMAVHFDVDEKKTTVEEPAVKVTDVIDTKTDVKKEEIQEISFDAEKFSVYGLIGTGAISKTILTADGKTLTVTVIYDEKAEIPNDAKLEVTEIQEDDEDWGDRSARFAGVLSEKYGNVTISDVRFLNIGIMVNGEEFEPKAPVEVKIQYNKSLYTNNTQDVFEDPELPEPIAPDGNGHFVMVHYTNQDAEMVDANIEETEDGVSESLSITPSFSEYDVAYVYEYNAPEAGSASSIETIGADYSPENANRILSTTPRLRAAADGTPIISKDLADNEDGTYQLGLSVTGDAVTSSTSSPVNVVIVYDVSLSMTGNYVPSNTGARGVQYYDNFDGVSDGEYFRLYKRTGYNNYAQITDDEAYTGTVYRYNNWRYTEYTGQRFHSSITRADAGEKVVYDFVHALFRHQDSSDRSNIQASLVTFANDATITQDWTSTENNITSIFSNTGTSHKRTYSSATNWEAAMYQAYSLVDSADSDPTYVVFITDGQPTSSRQNGHYINTDVSGSFANVNYGRALNEARLVEQAVANKGGALYSIYAYGKAADWLSSLTYYAYNGRRPSSSDEGKTFETEGYYNASDTEALTAAINEIFAKIVDTLGVGSVSINDGTTNVVQTTTGTIAELLEVDTGSFQYWLNIPVVASGSGYSFSMIDKATGETVNYTATVSGDTVTIRWGNGNNSATYKGKVNAGSLTLEWVQASSFYNFAPPAATFNDTTGAVDWDLNALGTLLNNVTYTVTFNVNPSQYTLDLIADLKNTYVEYDSLDANIQKYIIKQGNDYKLATNTGATLTYKDTRIDDKEHTKPFIDPPPQSTSATKAVALSKDWSNILDNRTKPSEMTMHVARSGEDRYELVLNDTDGWEDTAYISFGIITIHEGTITVKAPGHDYSFTEPADMEYYWELNAPTLRPMLINSVETLLVKVDKSEAPDMEGANATAVGPDGATYYKLTIDSGAEYYRVDDSTGATVKLKAFNYRRSFLDVIKKVDETNAPADAIFPFTMKVTNSNASSGVAGDTNSDYYVWFSISENGTDNIVTDPNPVSAEGIGYQLTDDSIVWNKPEEGFKGYYIVPSGKSISVNMKAGYDLRFLNLPTGSTYEVTESSDLPDESFSLENITGIRSYKENDTPKSENVGTKSKYGISGTIDYANSDYTMTFDNKYSSINIGLKKVDEKGVEKAGAVFNLARYSNGAWSGIQTDIKPGDTESETTNPVSLGGLGIGKYRLTEIKSPSGYIILDRNVDFEVYKDSNGKLKARLSEGTDTNIVRLNEESEGNYIVSVKNTPGEKLPMTGGTGTSIYTLGGLFLMITAALMYVFRMRRRERRVR